MHMKPIDNSKMDSSRKSHEKEPMLKVFCNAIFFFVTYFSKVDDLNSIILKFPKKNSLVLSVVMP